MTSGHWRCLGSVARWALLTALTLAGSGLLLAACSGSILGNTAETIYDAATESSPTPPAHAP